MSLSNMLWNPSQSANQFSNHPLSVTPNSQNPVSNDETEDAASRLYPWHQDQHPHGYDFERGDRLRERYELENPFRSEPETAPREANSSSGPARHAFLTPIPSENEVAASDSFSSTPTRPPRITLRLNTQNHDLNYDHHQQQQKQEEDEEDGQENELCEFSTPCHMSPSPDGMHYRKVVSHVFGRNKASTKLFPSSVWVHYCRKHYQRARYRADQWPFTQCELLLESLNRMEAWGGVESFELILRRREKMRVDDDCHEEDSKQSRAERGEEAAVPKTKRAQLASSTSGRKRPTPVTAPVPHWLRGCVGRGLSFNDVREIISRVREHMAQLREGEKNRQVQQAVGRQSVGRSSATRTSRRSSLDNLGQRTSRVRFPDIEILPTFRPWVLEAALRQRSSEQLDDPENEVRGDEGADDNRAEGPDGNHTVPGAQPPRADIGRVGSNRGASRSQRRRSERLFLKTLARMSEHGAVKKPRK